MERLTEKVYGYTQLKSCGNDFCKETCAKYDEERSCNNCPIQKSIEKLAEYEDLEEQGLLLKLPCKVGDTVYEVQQLRKRIQPYKIVSIHISCSVLFSWELKDGKGIYSNINGFCDYAIGKTVFLTQEQAEQELKQLKAGGKNE